MWAQYWRWALPLKQMLLGFLVTPVKAHLITYDYFQMKFRVSFKPLKGLSIHWYNCHSALYSAVGHKFGSNPKHVQTVFQNALNQPKQNPNILATTRPYSFTRSTFSSVMLADGCPKYLAYSKEVAQHLNLKNNTKTCVLHTAYLPKASFNILKVSLVVCLGLKQNLMQIHHSSTPKSQMKQHTFVLNKTLLNHHTCHSLIPSRKWLSRLYCICKCRRSLCYHK